MSATASKEDTRDTVASVSGELDVCLNSQKSDDGGKSVEYDDALCATGYGLYHYILVTTGGLACASNAIELLCVSILMPAAECDLHMTSAEKGWLSSAVFLGKMLGGFVGGCLGDIYGRRPVLIVLLLISALAALASSFIQSYELFIVFRFISGAGVGGSFPLVWTYFSEFQPSYRRGGALSVISTFWSIGNILVAVFALVTIPYDIGFESPSFSYNSWRIFTTICALPSLCTAIVLIWLPESPLFLIVKGEQEEALAILKKMYTRNTKKSPLTYPVKSINTASLKTEVDTEKNCWGKFSSLFLSTWRHASDLFSRALIHITVICFAVSFTIEFGYYGLWLWFPELFNRLELYYNDHPDARVSVCELQGYNSNVTETSHCDTGEPPIDTAALYNTLITAVAPLPTCIFTIFFMDKFGRKFFLVLGMVLSGLAAFSIFFVKTSVDNLIVSCVYGAVSSLAFNALACIGAELYPSYIRATSLAVSSLVKGAASILANVAFGYLLDTNCAIPILLVASLLIGGGVLGLLLPNTSRTALT